MKEVVVGHLIWLPLPALGCARTPYLSKAEYAVLLMLHAPSCDAARPCTVFMPRRFPDPQECAVSYRCLVPEPH